MSSENPYAPPATTVTDIASPDPTPLLWNPNAAASWSLLLSPVFGSILHMKNWQAMGDKKKAATSRHWAIGNAAFIVALTVLSMALPDAKAIDALTRLAGFALLIAWYYNIGKSQSDIVLARYGKDYPRKGWVKPLGIAIGLFIAFVVVIGLVDCAIGMLMGTDELAAN